MRRPKVAVLVLLACMLVVPEASAFEPDGRVAIRYEWLNERTADGSPRRLRITLTPLVRLEGARVEATSPSKAPALAHRGAPWPERGLEVGELPARTTTVIEVDVVEPAAGGEILTLTVTGESGGDTVRETIGIPVGEPGKPSQVRHGAVEFPAGREERQP